VDTGATVRVDFAMEVGAAAESITVNADASVINTETGESASLITAEQVSELALNGRNFTKFLALSAGVVSQQTGHQVGLGQEGNPLTSVNGGRITMNCRFWKGMLVQASYTFANPLGDPEGMPRDSRNKDLDYGPLNVARRHALPAATSTSCLSSADGNCPASSSSPPVFP